MYLYVATERKSYQNGWEKKNYNNNNNFNVLPFFASLLKCWRQGRNKGGEVIRGIYTLPEPYFTNIFQYYIFYFCMYASPLTYILLKVGGINGHFLVHFVKTNLMRRKIATYCEKKTFLFRTFMNNSETMSDHFHTQSSLVAVKN